MSLAQQATYYRAALLLGLVRGEAVVRWAEAVIASENAPPAPVIDAAMTEAGDLTALRLALQPLAAEWESPAIVRALLDRVHIDAESKSRDVRDSIRIIGQVRRHLSIGSRLSDDIDTLEDDFMLAAAGVTGDVAEVSDRATMWLTQFRGAEAALLLGISYHVVDCGDSGSTAAFVAALSRLVASPSGLVGIDGAIHPERVEGWVSSVGGEIGCEVYLTSDALRVAETAFSPVPIARICQDTDLAIDAMLVIDGRTPHGMGIDEAEATLARRS